MEDKNGDKYILAGYPWFKARARDTFVALPGLTLSIEEDDYFENAMKTAEKGLREFMDGKPLSVKLYEIEQPDVLLWAVWCIQQYAKERGIEKCGKKYGKLVLNIISYIEDQRHPNLTLEDNGLVKTDGKERPVTWMNSMSSGRPVSYTHLTLPTICSV